MPHYAVIRIPVEDHDEALRLAQSMADDEWPLVFFSDREPCPRSVLDEVEAERIAVCDAWRAQMEAQGMPKVTAALLVQDVLDNA